MDKDSNRLDDIQQDLYKRGQGPLKPRPWSRFSKSRGRGAGDWQHKHRKPDEDNRQARERTNIGLPMKLFIFSTVFFIVALTIAAFIISRGSNLVSSDNIDITVSGPVLVEGGEEVSLQVDIFNGNNAALELAHLIVEFPDGTRTTSGTDEPLQRMRETLGDVQPGSFVSKTVTARFFGEESEKKEIAIGIEYRVTDSNAIFFKEKVFVIEIGDTPISLLIDIPQEVISEEEIEITVEVVSNSSERIDNVALSIEYPFGFVLQDAQPSPQTGNATWFLGTLNPQDRRTVRLQGIIEGQDDEERTFRFVGGLVDPGREREIETALLSTKHSIAIRRPFLQAALALGGSSEDVLITQAASPISGIVEWQNNLSEPVEDVVVTVELQGDILDETRVEAPRGFYRSLSNTIVWDTSRESSLAQVAPGAKGELRFGFASVDPRSRFFENGTLDVLLRITGNRLGDSRESSGEIASSDSATVLFESAAALEGKALYASGPLANIGPMPPQAEQATTYTIVWTVTNSTNDLAGASVSAALPDYMSYIGSVSPSGADVSFNEIGREVRWNIGTLSAGTGYTQSPREVAFQVRLLPSVSQIGTAPTLVGSATFRGQDVFTDTSLSSVLGQLTTILNDDPSHMPGDDRVVE